MKAQKVFEFQEEFKNPYKALDVGNFKNLIDYNNLPTYGIWKIIAGDSNDDFDECIININRSNGLGMVKAWETSEAARDGYEWSEDWELQMDGDMMHIGAYHELTDFLKEAGAYNMIEMEAIDRDYRPNWDNIQIK